MEPKTQRLFFVAITKIIMDRLLLGGDVESKLGPKQSFVSTFSICHWNLNSISAHTYVKISLLKAYIMIQKFGNFLYI